MSVKNEIEKILGREIEFQETDKGFIPVYINYNFQAKIADMYSKDEEECATKFLEYLETLQGDTDANNTDDPSNDRGSSDND